MVACSSVITAPARSRRSSGQASAPHPDPPPQAGEGNGLVPRKRRVVKLVALSIGLVDRFKELTDWLTNGEAAASQGYLTSADVPLHRPSRRWYGQVMPGSWHPTSIVMASTASFPASPPSRRTTWHSTRTSSSRRSSDS